MAQPRALEDTLAGLKMTPALRNIVDRATSGCSERIVLTGMGGSFWALEPLRIQLLNDGWMTLMAETSELIHATPGILDHRTLLIVASQSGRSAEIVKLLDLKRTGCVTIWITNTPGSPLAEMSDAAVLTRAGREFAVSCKTDVTTLMAVEWLV